ERAGLPAGDGLALSGADLQRYVELSLAYARAVGAFEAAKKAVDEVRAARQAQAVVAPVGVEVIGLFAALEELSGSAQVLLERAFVLRANAPESMLWRLWNSTSRVSSAIMALGSAQIPSRVPDLLGEDDATVYRGPLREYVDAVYEL